MHYTQDETHSVFNIGTCFQMGGFKHNHNNILLTSEKFIQISLLTVNDGAISVSTQRSPSYLVVQRAKASGPARRAYS